MSNGILYDPLLVRQLAVELDRRLRGRACAAAPLFSSDRSAVLPLDRGEALRLDLHPSRGWIRVVPWTEQTDEHDARCEGVEAPPDERLLIVHLRSGDRFRAAGRRLVVELHSNQWNVLLVGQEDGRILSVLRAREAGDRVLWPGHPYRPPVPAARIGTGELGREEARSRWDATLRGVAPGDRRGALLRSVAWAGAPNAAWILGDSAREPDPAALDAAFERWWRIRETDGASPALLHTPRGLLPYPVPLEGVPAEPAGSLLAGMERIAEAGAPDTGAREDDERAARVRRRIATIERRIERLREEAEASGDADRYRGWGDLLLARLHRVERGATETVLEGWEGESVRVPLDPTLSPAENAARWYDEARRRERARERIPSLEARARRDLERWREAERSLDEGELPDWAVDALEAEAADAGGAGDGGTETRPYRVYRTSGGLEVRVGRSARENDRLTFGHSRPHDVWLHARSVPGSHVILRWSDPEGAPPARDLEEAATLAALFSRARTSTLVPVDWTRRRHVRKPRGAPPGSVVPQRVKTLFVEPDPRLEERLKGED